MGELATVSTTEARQWPTVKPLHSHYEPLPYPLDALPSLVRGALIEVQGYVQAPAAMIASCALSVMAIATQGHIDVARDNKLIGPVSLYFITLGESGERKTTVDKLFTGGITDYQFRVALAMSEDMQRYKAEIEAHKAKCTGVLSQIKKLAQNSKPTEAKEQEHKDLVKAQPKRPKVPNMLLTDATQEGLLYSLAYDWPSAAIVSDEGGAVFGSHGMGKDSVMRYLSTLNSLWGGGTQHITRRTSESFNVVNPRLTVHIQIQAPTLQEFLNRTGELARGTGFLARFCISNPTTTQGTRLYKDPPNKSPKLDAFNKQIDCILSTDLPFNERGELEPALMQLSVEAKEVWVDFHDKVESRLAAGGEFQSIRDTASKVADNAVRIAALFAYFESFTSATPVSEENMRSGVAVATWHLYESQRFFEELAISDDDLHAVQLNDWLIRYCTEKFVDRLTRREVLQLGPNSIRDKDKRDRALNALADAGRVVLEKIGNSDFVLLNPELFAECPL